MAPHLGPASRSGHPGERPWRPLEPVAVAPAAAPGDPAIGLVATLDDDRRKVIDDMEVCAHAPCIGGIATLPQGKYEE